MPNATVLPPSTINVRVGSANPPTVTSISYGGNFTLKAAGDLNMDGATDGDVIVYKSATNSFAVEPVDYIISIDGGTY
tara:strand:+ start:1198 stop:1431 length:234 start_codon:yes stop_codon:yes gene_type:complete